MPTRTNLAWMVKNRRIGALARLELQLKRGKKGGDDQFELSDKDRERMEGEIAILQTRTR